MDVDRTAAVWSTGAMRGGRRSGLAMACKAESVARHVAMTDDAPTSGGYTRRHVLQAGAVLGGAALLAAGGLGPTRARAAGRGGAPDASVANIGAGLAGIAAAYQLHRVGISSQVFEARGRIGGRCWTARGFADGQTAEHGGEFIDTRHVHLRGLATELGLQFDDLWQGDVPGAISPSWINGGYFDYYDKFNAQLDRITTAVKAAA